MYEALVHIESAVWFHDEATRSDADHIILKLVNGVVGAHGTARDQIIKFHG
jgi:hypothetical protein